MKYIKLLTCGLLALGTAATSSALVITNMVGTNDGVADQSQTLTAGFISSNLNWMHSYGAIVGNILSATLEIDIIDADNGNLRLYAGTDNSGIQIGTADPAGNNSGGGPGPWRNPTDTALDPSFTFTLSSSLYADLADGTFDVFGQNIGMSIWGSNRAILTIETDGIAAVQDTGSTFAFLGLAIASIAAVRRRIR